MKYFLVFCLLILFTDYKYGQSTYEVTQEHYFYESKIPQFIKFSEESELKIQDLSLFFKENYKLDLELKELSKKEDELGFTHYKFQQYFQKHKIELGIINVHTIKDNIISINGYLIHELTSINTTYIDEANSLSKVLKYVGADKYKWENEKEENWLKVTTKNRFATFYPKGELTWCSKNFDKSTPLKLAYKFEVYAERPLSKSAIYIDVITNEILAQNEIIHHIDAVGSGTTGFSGQQTITTDFNGGIYRLREVGRGNGVETYDMQNGFSYANAVDFTNTTNNWNAGTPQDYLFALDAHWGSEMVYDYYLSQHNRNSIDDNGFKLRSYIHYDVNFGNAFWDGSVMTYGDGSTGANPFTTLDIVAHEITHGLTTNTAGLIYSYESGALNESFSDIFGASTEWFAKPNQANWLIGDERGTAIRSLSNPNLYGHPDTYKGNNWEFTAFDNGGVHINSSVQNYWFYLLVNGGNGTNDNGDSYNVTSIGQTKAAKIAFRNLTTYLTNSSNFIEARFYSIQSTIDLYGACSPEVKSVTDAWFAVGVGSPYSIGVTADFMSNITTGCEVPFTVDFQNLSVNGTSFTWNFGDGTTSTSNFPTHTYTTLGTYNVSLLADGGACGTNQETKTGFITIDNSIPCTDMIANSTVSRSTCSGELFDSGGENGNYSENENSYALISPNSGLPFVLNIDFIDIEEEVSCNYDVLKIYDGISTSGNLVGEICNNSSYSPSITSSTGSLYLHFYSDPLVEGGGFKVSWDCSNGSSTVQTEDNCEGDRTDSGGSNGNYGDNETSIVLIQPLGATQIELQFNFFDVETHANCNYDYLEVYDGNSVNAPLIGRYCNGTPPPSVIQSTGAALTIKFSSDVSLTEAGYEYSWTCKSSGVDVDENKSVLFNLYPNPSNGFLFLEYNNQLESIIKIKDLLGKEVFTGNSYLSNHEIDVSSLSKGAYLMEVYQEEKLIGLKKVILE